MLTFQGFIVLPLTFRSIIHQKIDFFKWSISRCQILLLLYGYPMVPAPYIVKASLTLLFSREAVFIWVFLEAEPWGSLHQGGLFGRQVAEVQDWGTKRRKQRKPFQGCALKLATAINHFCSILLRNLTKCNLPAWEQKEERFLHWVLHWPRLVSWVFTPLCLQVVWVRVLCALALCKFWGRKKKGMQCESKARCSEAGHMRCQLRPTCYCNSNLELNVALRFPWWSTG